LKSLAHCQSFIKNSIREESSEKKKKPSGYRGIKRGGTTRKKNLGLRRILTSNQRQGKVGEELKLKNGKGESVGEERRQGKRPDEGKEVSSE